MLTRVGWVPALVLLHEFKTLHHGIFHGTAFKHGNILVIGVLQAETATGKSCHATQVSELGSQGCAGPHGGVLLRRKKADACGVALG